MYLEELEDYLQRLEPYHNQTIECIIGTDETGKNKIVPLRISGLSNRVSTKEPDAREIFSQQVILKDEQGKEYRKGIQTVVQHLEQPKGGKPGNKYLRI